MSEPKVELRDGSEWADHEDCIVGNAAGIEALKSACDEALRTGEHYSKELGDYVGVKKLSDEWFEDARESTTTKFANYVLGFVILFVLGSSVYGVYSMVKGIISS